MRVRNLVWLPVLALVLSACSLFAAERPQFDSLEAYYSQSVTWKKCGKFQCAEVAVPLNYEDLSQGTVLLSVMKHEAKAAKSSLLVNPGGPGGSGIEYLSAFETQFTKQVIDNFDLVSWDPRGVGESAPVECVDDGELDAFLAEDATPDTAAEESAFLESYRDFYAECLQKTKEVLPNVNTTATVRDLDILRAIVGDTKLNYLGKSYGTVIGAVYAHMFPERVGRFVLDGAVDVSLSSTELALGQAIGFDTSLQRFATYCVQNSDICDLGRTQQEVIDFIMDLLSQLDRKPMKTTNPDRDLVESLAWTAIIGPMYIPDGGWDWLIEALAFAREGDGSMLLDISDWYNNRDLDGRYLDNASEAFTAITCADGGARSAPSKTLLPMFNEAAPLTGALLAWGESMCSSWPVSEVPLTEDVSAPSAAPILVIGTTFDPATPDVWARSLADELEVGVYINYNGDGHTAYMSGSRALDAAVDAYFRNGTLPASGTSYKPDQPLLSGAWG